MNAVWGVDLGIRTVSMARIGPEGELTVFKLVVPPGATRQHELRKLSAYVSMNVTDGLMFVEEPPMVRNTRTFLQLGETAGAVMASGLVEGYFVPVSSWKVETHGKGNANKTDVSGWLAKAHMAYSQRCDGDQDLIDATCIALYGREIIARVI